MWKNEMDITSCVEKAKAIAVDFPCRCKKVEQYLLVSLIFVIFAVEYLFY